MCALLNRSLLLIDRPLLPHKQTCCDASAYCIPYPRASGVPYTIVRAYSLNNDAARIAATKDDTSTVVLQMRGDPATVGGVITRPNLATVTVEALLMPQTEGVTFEALDVRTSLNPEYPPWQKILKEDLEKDPPLTQEQVNAKSDLFVGVKETYLLM
jgi:hypothetical protein